MISTHKQEATTASTHMINNRPRRLTIFCCLLIAYCLFSFWYYSNEQLFSYEKWQLAGLIFIVVGAILAVILQHFKHESLLFEYISGVALIGGAFLYFIGTCIHIKDRCYCNGCVDAFECGCDIFGQGVIIFGTSIAIGIDVITNYLSYHRIRMIILSSILLLASIFILINRFHYHHKSAIKTVEEVAWVLILIASLLIIIFIGMIGLATHHIYNGMIAFLLFIGGILVLIGGIGGYTSSHFHDSYNGTIWIFYILVCLECIILGIDVLTGSVREYQPLK